jgi:hypothetical protein
MDAIFCRGDAAVRGWPFFEYKADYLLALKGNQPTLEAELADYFCSAPAEERVIKTRKLKGHGRIKMREPTRLRPRSTGLSLTGVIRSNRASPT